MNFSVKSAQFSTDRKHRFSLYREWDFRKSKVGFIGLNPSTANEIVNDNTIIKCAKIAANNGFGGFYMLNLFTFVTAYPEELLKCENPALLADEYLFNHGNECEKVVFCWGSFKQAKERAREIIDRFNNPYCLKINADGSPKHPLYCLDNSQLIKFNH